MVCCCFFLKVWAMRRKERNKKYHHPRHTLAMGLGDKASASVHPVFETIGRRKRTLLDLEASIKAKGSQLDLSSDEGSVEERDPGENLNTSSSAGILGAQLTTGTLPGSLDDNSSLDGRSSVGGGDQSTSWEDGSAPVNPAPLPPTARKSPLKPSGVGKKARRAFQRPTEAAHELHGLEFDNEEQVSKMVQESLNNASKLLLRGTGAGKLRGVGRRLVGGGIPRLGPQRPTPTPKPSAKKSTDKEEEGSASSTTTSRTATEE